MELTTIEHKLLSILIEQGSIRGTAHVGYALWPERRMQPQGSALAAGKVLRRMIDLGCVSSFCDYNLSRYEVTQKGRDAWGTCEKEKNSVEQLNLLSE